MKESLGEEESTRASFLEKVLSSEILEEGEGIVGEVAKTGKPVFVANAQSDPRIVRHPIRAGCSIHGLLSSHS